MIKFWFLNMLLDKGFIIDEAAFCILNLMSSKILMINLMKPVKGFISKKIYPSNLLDFNIFGGIHIEHKI
jgi:hypothetical protein